MTKPIQVDFAEDVYDTLVGIAHERGSTLSGVLQDACSLVKYANDVCRDGGRILVEHADGTRAEVLWKWKQ